MERISIQEAEQNLEDLLHLVSDGKQRFVLEDNQGTQAALLSTEDLELLRTLDPMPKKDPVDRIGVPTLRGHLKDRIGTLGEPGTTGRVIVTEQGDEVAALVPLKDLQKLMGLDGEIDLAAAKQLLDKQLRRD